MGRPVRILIVHVPAGGGHRAAALALARAATSGGHESGGYEAEVVDALDFAPAWFARSLVAAHFRSTERAPDLYGRIYDATNQPSAVARGFRAMAFGSVGKDLRRFVAERRADVVIATHFFPLTTLAAARIHGELRAPLVGVVTDYAAHAFWAARGVDVYAVPPGRAARDLVRHGISPSRIVVTGIPVRSEFGDIPVYRAPARDEPVRVLVTSGGFVVGPMAETIRSFERSPDDGRMADVELTVVCGANSMRVDEARRVVAASSIRAEVLGAVDDMPSRVANAHVVVGKPGGLTVSEVLAAGRPMVVIGACPGQEMSNQDFMRKCGAAIAVSPEDAGAAVRALVGSGRLAAMASAARRASSPNAARLVLDAGIAISACRRAA